MLLGVGQQSFDAFRQLAGVHHPIAQRGVVLVALVLAAKPAIVHDEQFATHRGYVCHHLVHAFLVDVKVDTFPAVQQDFAQLVAVGQLVFAPPAVEVAAGAAQPLVTVGQGQLRGDERLTLLQEVGGVVLVDAREEVVVFIVVRVDAQLVIAAVAERGTDDTSLVLTRLSVQRKHHFGMVGVRIARTVLVLDDLHARH